MRSLVPTPDNIDPVDAYGRLGRLGPRRPRVRLNMIASVDGAAALDGRSGALGGRADKALFAVLRWLADVILMAGDTEVDLIDAVHALAARGHDNVLGEGGPVVAAELAAAGLLDELCLTVSPLLAGGDAHRILAGSALAPTLRLELGHVLEADGYLFLRYRRR